MNQPANDPGSAVPAQSSARPRIILIIIGLVLLVLVAFVSWRIWSARQTYSLNLQGAEMAYNANAIDAALRAVDATLEKDPANLVARINKSLFLAQKGSLEFKEQEYGTQAVAVANEAIALDPKSTEAWRALGYAYEIMQKYGEAHAAYEKSLELSPRNVLAIFGNAHAYDLEGDLVKAEEGYRAALAEDQDNEEARTGLARILANQGDTEGALAQLNQVYQSTANARVRAEAAFSIGLIKSAQKDTAGARTYMENAAAIDSAYPLAWYGIGLIFFDEALAPGSATAEARGAAIKSSIANLTTAIQLNPNQSVAYLQLARSFAFFGKPEVSLQILETAKAAVPLDITLNAPSKEDMLERIETARTEIETLQARAAANP